MTAYERVKKETENPNARYYVTVHADNAEITIRFENKDIWELNENEVRFYSEDREINCDISFIASQPVEDDYIEEFEYTIEFN